jgi:hypothetical protein
MLIQSKTVPTQYQRWLITQVLEDINHFTWTVTMLDSNGAIFTNTQPVLMSYSFNGTGAISLDNLSDVQIVAPTTGQTLVYNGSISQWVNTSAVGALSLDDLSDVTIATPVLGNALVYDGVDWKNSPNWIYSTPDANMKALEFDRLKIESFTHASAPYSYVTLTVQPFGPNIGSELFIKSSLMQWNGAQGGVIQVYDNSDSSASINLNNGYITGLITSGASGEATSVDYVFEQDELRVSTSGDIIYGGINFTNPSAASPDDLTTIIYAKPDATSNPELQIFGGYWQTTFDNSPKTHGVRIGGSYIALESPDISMRLNGAQVGGRVVVAGLTERGNAILGVEPPPVPDYVVSATGTTGVTIYTNGGATPSPWIDLTNSLTINQAIPPSSGTVYFETLIENTGSKTGTFEIGVSLNGAAPISANTIDYNIGPAVKQIFANTAVNAALVPIGTTVKLQARVITSGNTFNLFARNTERPSLIKVTVNGSGGGGGATTLGQLTDVSLTSPTNNQVLTYNGSLWVNADPSGGGGPFLPLAGGVIAEPGRISWGNATPDSFSIGTTHPNGNYNLYVQDVGINMFAGDGFTFQSSFASTIATFMNSSAALYIFDNSDNTTLVRGLTSSPTDNSDATSKGYVDAKVAAGPASIDGGTY